MNINQDVHLFKENNAVKSRPAQRSFLSLLNTDFKPKMTKWTRTRASHHLIGSRLPWRTCDVAEHSRPNAAKRRFLIETRAFMTFMSMRQTSENNESLPQTSSSLRMCRSDKTVADRISDSTLCVRCLPQCTSYLLSTWMGIGIFLEFFFFFAIKLILVNMKNIWTRSHEAWGVWLITAVTQVNYCRCEIIAETGPPNNFI